MSGVPGDLRRGTILALVLGSACLLVARYGLGNLSQLGLLLSVAMMFLLLVAWILMLRADGCFRGAVPEDPPVRTPEAGGGPERFHVAFGDRLLERPHRAGETVWTRREVQRALVWAAVELGLASIALSRLPRIG